MVNNSLTFILLLTVSSTATYGLIPLKENVLNSIGRLRKISTKTFHKAIPFLNEMSWRPKDPSGQKGPKN